MFTNAIGNIVMGPAHDPFRRRTRLLFTRVSTRSHSTVCGWKKRRSTRRIVRHDVHGDWMWVQQTTAQTCMYEQPQLCQKMFTRDQTHARTSPNTRTYF